MASFASPSSSQPSTRSPKTPATKVKIPKAATTYTPTDSNPDLRSQINALLLSEGHIEKIQASLTQSLSAHPSNWPTLIRAHALSLLRSGDATSFPILMERVLEDIKADTDALPDLSTLSNTDSQVNANNGSATLRLGTTPSSRGDGGTDDSSQSSGDVQSDSGKGKGKGKEVEAKKGEGRVSLSLPRSVVDEGVRVTRECLKDMVTVED